MRILAAPPGAARPVITDRADGNLALHVGPDPAAVQARRRAVEQRLGVPAGHLLFLEQVHGTQVAVAEEVPPLPADLDPEGERALAPVADAALTTRGRALAVLTADCLPVLLGTEDPLIGAVAHAGRRGLLDGILPTVLRRLAEAGVRRVSAWIGPAICAGCYEVPEEMAAEAERILPGIRARTTWGTPSLDLPGAAARQLRATAELLGLDLELEEAAGGCTREDPEQFSHRRAPGQGRLAAILGPPAAPGARGHAAGAQQAPQMHGRSRG